MSAAGVFNILNGLGAGPEMRGQNTPTTAPSCSSRRPVLQEILTDHRKPAGSPQTMPIVQYSLDNTKMMSMVFHHNHTIHFLRGWSKSITIQSTTFHTLTASQNVPTIPPVYYTSLTDWAGLEGLCQANGGVWLRSKVTQREGAPTPTHARVCEKSTARKDACTAHGARLHVKLGLIGFFFQERTQLSRKKEKHTDTYTHPRDD